MPTPAEVERLLGSLIPLAMARAHHYEAMWGQDHGEFGTAALVGAWDAIAHYDPTRGASLHTYARWRIDGTIVDWHREEMAQKGGNRRGRKPALCVDFTDLTIHDERLSVASVIEHHFGRTNERGYDLVEDDDLLRALRVRMDPREWDVMVRCVCNDEREKAVGDSYGVSESRISQILHRALAHARAIIDEMDAASA